MSPRLLSAITQCVVLLASVSHAMAADAPSGSPTVVVGTAPDPEYGKYRGKVRLGLEVELVDPFIGNILHFFDPQSYESAIGDEFKHMKPADQALVLRDYVLSDRALAALPEDVRARLTQGLDLESKLITSPQGAASTKSSRLKITSIEIHDSSPILGLDGKPVVKKQNSQEILLERWNAIPTAERLQWVRSEYLPRDTRASLFINAVEKGNAHVRSLQLLPSAPEVLRKFSWHKDGSAMEFTLRDDLHYQDVREFLKVYEEFTKLSGTYLLVQKPERSALYLTKGFSHHFHLSNQENQSVNLRKRLEVYNDWLLLKLVAAGDSGVLDPSISTYRSGLSKGLVSWVSPSQFEQRKHYDGPEAELKQLLRWMIDLPEEQAIAEMKSQMASLFTEERLAFILKRYPSASILTASAALPHLKKLAAGADPGVAAAARVFVEIVEATTLAQLMQYLAYEETTRVGKLARARAMTLLKERPNPELVREILASPSKEVILLRLNYLIDIRHDASTVFEIFKDGLSASSDERPGFYRMFLEKLDAEQLQRLGAMVKEANLDPEILKTIEKVRREKSVGCVLNGLK